VAGDLASFLPDSSWLTGRRGAKAPAARQAAEAETVAAVPSFSAPIIASWDVRVIRVILIVWILISDNGVLDFVHFRGLPLVPGPFSCLPLALVFIKVVLEEVTFVVPTIIIVVVVVVMIIIVAIVVVVTITRLPASIIVVVPVVIIIPVTLVLVAVIVAVIRIAMADSVRSVVSPRTISMSPRRLIVGIHRIVRVGAHG
jgi:hypothetical protein